VTEAQAFLGERTSNGTSRPVKHFKAIAAMSENRVIGQGSRIPWHLPEDFKWFKKMTMGNIAVMGRRTFESLRKPLPNRKSLVLTRHPRQLINSHPEVFGQFKEWRGGEHLKRPYQFHFAKLEGDQSTDVLICNSLEKLVPAEFPTDLFICGGAEIYAQTLPRCSDLFLTLVKRRVEGDAFFPAFEHKFVLKEKLHDTPEFEILHYQNQSLT